jgi:hypothetical protein
VGVANGGGGGEEEGKGFRRVRRGNTSASTCRACAHSPAHHVAADCIIAKTFLPTQALRHSFSPMPYAPRPIPPSYMHHAVSDPAPSPQLVLPHRM